MPINILKIEIRQSMDCDLHVATLRDLEKFRKSLAEQVRIGTLEDTVEVSFVLKTEDFETIKYPRHVKQ